MFRYRFPASLLAAGAGWILTVSPAAAQSFARRATASVQASATVVASRMSASFLHPLRFEPLSGGRGASVQPTDASAAAWRLVGNPHDAVLVGFSLPTELTGSDGAATLPISFSATSGRLRQDVDQAGGGVTFDPNRGTLGRFADGPAPSLYMWIGATVQAPATADRGSYRGTITLTVAYL